MEKINHLEVAAQLLKDNPALMECIIDEVIDRGIIKQCERCEAWEYKDELRNNKCQHCQ